MTRPPSPLRRAALPALLAAALTLTACSTTADDAQPPNPVASSTAAPMSYPVDVQNCGRTLHFAKEPARIVSGWTTSTDLLVRLGLGDRIVGQYNTASGTADPAYTEQERKIPVLAENGPTKEQLLATRPDLIWADGDYLFDGKQLPTIAQLNADGIQVMILSGFCTADATGAKVDDVLTDLDALGTVFGRTAVQQRTAADVRTRLAAVQDRVRGAEPAPVAFVSIYDKTIYTYTGVYTDMADLAGGRNLYADALPKGSYYAPVSIEDLIAKNPQNLVYLLAGGETTTQAKRTLSQSLGSVAAVRDDHVVYLPSGGSTNLAAVDAVEDLSALLHPAS